ncbi:copper resistance protein B [Luteibacter aegosomatis]|uniref:copper resistance protein B n=1 Tax=Luteibacter aegosomatis TaxID=2911537 RepID=UPI001FF944C1|nr:copper resistance protein B [Luteibacter aegosomatis]UPG85640.1 copper resistance protein B [Luteibacter aegosomatis]
MRAVVFAKLLLVAFPAMSQEMDHAMHGMTMGPMQGGHAPADARSDDWSDGVAPAPMHDMDMMGMDDTAPVGNLLLDRLEAFAGQGGHGQSWEAEGWYGNDVNKLWMRSEGEREGGRPRDGDVEAFWSHAIAPFWDAQLGLRSDIGEGPERQWAAFGVQGLAPYRFELEATAYVGQGGRTAARVRGEYELLFTQRLILQPELEINAYGRADPRRGLGAGVSSIEGGLRLRYEFTRSFAPYVGVDWEHLAGATADIARDAGRRVTDRRWVAGVRLWF